MIRSTAVRRRARRQLIGGILALAAALAVTGSAAWWWFAGRGPELDPDTLCPLNGPRGHAVLLVDRTDPLNFTQRQAFLAYLTELGRDRLGEGELLTVFALGEELTASAEPLFAMCHPGRGQGRDRWTSNPERLRRRFEDRFLKPVMALADRLQATTPARHSPLMEMLQLVAIKGFRARPVTGPRRLFVVSDMLHNTPAYSQYRDPVDFQWFRETPLFHKVKTDLGGVEVELAYLLNAPARQTRRQAKFWEDYFEAQGARLVAVRILEG
ncbi:hypothetical protein [Candidatus Methylocalor cossyra]|uniref:Uncharacterized protein n=1 Tax=Candidatus Methylocalor cossyra TaxID=3108543 RepID=A0ABM9NJK9_9GAMM